MASSGGRPPPTPETATPDATLPRPLSSWIDRLLVPDAHLGGRYLWPRWIFLRALGLIFFSAFFSLADQVHGLVGEQGILPAGYYLQQVHEAVGGLQRYWLAPTLFWLGVRRPGARPGRRGGAPGLAPPDRQRLAAADDRRVHPPLPLLRRRPAGVLVLPVGRDAAGGGLPLPLLRAAGGAARPRCRRSALAAEPPRAGVGVVPDLLRVGHRQAGQRRPALARLHGDGRLLPERSPPDVDRLVRPAPAALVPGRDGGVHARRRAPGGLGGVPAAGASGSAASRW